MILIGTFFLNPCPPGAKVIEARMRLLLEFFDPHLDTNPLLSYHGGLR